MTPLPNHQHRRHAIFDRRRPATSILRVTVCTSVVAALMAAVVFIGPAFDLLSRNQSQPASDDKTAPAVAPEVPVATPVPTTITPPAKPTKTHKPSKPRKPKHKPKRQHRDAPTVQPSPTSSGSTTTRPPSRGPANPAPPPTTSTPPQSGTGSVPPLPPSTSNPSPQPPSGGGNHNCDPANETC